MGQVESASSAIQPEDLVSWLPVDATIHDGKPAIEWMRSTGVEFTEPFFHQTIERVRAEGTSQQLLTEFDLLLRAEKVFDSVEPSGFIFHSSRCGSTLLSNACRALQGSIVISEAPVLDKIVSRFFTDAETETKLLLYKLFLKGAVRALGQRRFGNERRLFIKFACTSTLHMKHIRSIWPKVPFVFLYRDPVEIIVSNLKTIPEWMVFESNPATAAAIAGVETLQLSKMSAEEFCARSLGRYFEEVAKNGDASTMSINYSQLNFNSLVSALRFFGVEPSADEVDAIRTISGLYSKDSTQSHAFKAGSALKRGLASDLAVEMADRWARRPFEDLERRAS
jgi:hypothetical protein